jgi:hypothetical protein
MAKKKKAASAKLVVEPPDKYFIEIGLDGRVAPRPDGTYPHLMSLVKVDRWDATYGDPWWFTNFNPHDEIVFRVCDYTEPATGMSIVDVRGIVISFLQPKNPQQLSKDVTSNDAPAGVICSGQNYFPMRFEKDYSLVMDKRPCWRLVGPEHNETPYSLTGTGGIALLRVTVTAVVQVGSATELRCFTHDPEIFVGEGGPPPRPPHGPY